MNTPRPLLLTCAATLGLLTPLASGDVVVFVFDQLLDSVLRIEDRNGDGDTLDAGEVTVFIDDSLTLPLGIDNAQGLFARGPHELLATDNFDPDNIVRLIDLNLDGDALDPGEQSVWHDGALPGGFTLTNPTCLSVGPDGAYYVLDNNTLDEMNPEAVYRLEDLNNDGDVADAGETTVHVVLSPAGTSLTTTFDVEFDAAGYGYTIDITDPSQIESIERIEPGGTGFEEWITSSELLSLGGYFILSTYELSYDPTTDEMIAVFGGPGGCHVVAFRDADGSGELDNANEIRSLWSEGANADGHTAGIPRDVFRAGDGSILLTDAFNDQVIHLVDANRDGDFNDLGETRFKYDLKTAEAAGQPASNLMLSVTAAVSAAICEGDTNSSGAVDIMDLLAILAAWGTDDANADLNDSGTVDVEDLLIVLAAWGPCR